MQACPNLPIAPWFHARAAEPIFLGSDTRNEDGFPWRFSNVLCDLSASVRLEADEWKRNPLSPAKVNAAVRPRLWKCSPLTGDMLRYALVGPLIALKGLSSLFSITQRRSCASKAFEPER